MPLKYFYYNSISNYNKNYQNRKPMMSIFNIFFKKYIILIINNENIEG